jgi:PAS domain S-box-containing protein
MDTDRNLLFGVLALQLDLIDAAQFVEGCTLWTTRKSTPLADLLAEKGWITTADKVEIHRLLERKLKKHWGDVKAGLAAVADDVKRSLAALDDPEIQHSLADLPPPPGHVPVTTLDHVHELRERYALTRLHATGGIGRVWLARDGNLGRDVALKELRPERADNTTLWSRFFREARITGQLEHPGIVPVYELARRSDDQQPFYTMRFVKGRTLSEAARDHHQKRVAGQDEPLALLALLTAFVVVCNTVAYAHARGVIHRDLKGHNVIVGNFGEVIVLDWGLAKLVDQSGEAEVETTSVLLDPGEGSGDVDLTAHGQAMGTPAYMAPEQAAGRSDLIDRRTDVYGLGAILYEILTGQPPFTGSDTHDVLRRVRQDVPVRPHQLWAGVPPTLETACLRALAKEPAARYASALELAQEVERWQEVQRRQAEEALRQQSALLKLLQVAAVAANEASAIEDALQAVLDQVCAHTGWPVGHAYIQTQDSPTELVPTTIWHLDSPQLYDAFRKVTETTRMPWGVGLPGRIRASGKPAWIMDVTKDTNFPRAKLAENIGVKAAFGFPVLAGAEVVAVLEFFAPEAMEPDELLLEVMAHIGAQLGRVVERQRAAKALRESELRFRSVAHMAKDAIIVADQRGHMVFWNQGAQMIFGYEENEVLSKPLTLLMPERYRDAHRAGMARLMATGEAHVIGRTVELHGLRKDGREFPLELSLATWSTEEGQFFSAIIRDITGRKRETKRDIHDLQA